MKLRLSNSEIIDLPTNFCILDRLMLVGQILAAYPEEFAYRSKMFDMKCGTRIDNNKLVKIKLDILGTYLIRADDQYTSDIMSGYKIERRPLQEVVFSNFKQEVVEINGWN